MCFDFPRNYGGNIAAIIDTIKRTNGRFTTQKVENIIVCILNAKKMAESVEQSKYAAFDFTMRTNERAQKKRIKLLKRYTFTFSFYVCTIKMFKSAVVVMARALVHRNLHLNRGVSEDKT